MQSCGEKRLPCFQAGIIKICRQNPWRPGEKNSVRRHLSPYRNRVGKTVIRPSASIIPSLAESFQATPT